MNRRILLVDDDQAMLRLVAFQLEEESIETITATTGAQALRLAREEDPAVIVLDLRLPDLGGAEVLKQLRADGVAAPVVILTAQGTIEQAVECMRLGASDFVTKPFVQARLVASINNALRQGHLEARVQSLSKELRKSSGFDAIVGNSSALRRTLSLLKRAAESDVTVLLEGESGTGKEVAARAIHAESRRCGAAFVAVNCGAIPEGLIESELFGHEKGAFTGAVGARPGRFEEADGGTIFLDEIGELRSDLQVKLLRVLQERQVQRIGGSRTTSIDVRVIAATNRDLRADASTRRFREDLYYRLAVFPVRLPPLREREGDVVLLADTFIRRFAARHNRDVKGLTPEARRALERHHWPGNVRELENVLERAVILQDGPAIALHNLPDEIAIASSVVSETSPPAQHDGTGDSEVGRSVANPEQGEKRGAEALLGLGTTEILPFDEIERRTVLHALQATDFNVHEAAARLRIGRATIYRMMRRHGITRQAGA